MEKVLIRTYSEEYEIHIAQIKLRQQGIESWIMNKKDSAYVPIGHLELYVLLGDKLIAEKFLDAD